MAYTMRRKIGMLLIFVVMMTGEAAVSEAYEECYSFIECYKLGLHPNIDDLQDAKVYYYTRAIERWDENKDSKQLLKVSKQLLADAYFNRGQGYARQNNMKKALHDFNMAAQFNNGDTNIYFWRGYAYLELGDFNKAGSDFNTILRIMERRYLTIIRPYYLE